MAEHGDKRINRLWLEITDRADVGANLNAPLYNKNGQPNWTYDLVQEVKEGDKVFHYKDRAIVGVSRAAGQSWFDDVFWAAHGSASRTARIEPHRRPGQYMSLEGYVSIEPILSLDEIRRREAEIIQVRDELSAQRGGALRFPFVRYRDQGLRAFQGYLVEFPGELAALFPSLIRAMERLDLGMVQATASEPLEVGTVYRAADENASAATRDPFSIDPALVERGCRGHAVTQNALAKFLRARGIEPLSPSSPEINFDLGWRSAGRFFVAEVKSCTNANVEKQLRLGLGQVLRYRSLLEDAVGGAVVAVVALETDLADASRRRLCDTLGVRLVAAPGFEDLGDVADHN
jgi:hypothetical protein